MRPVFRWLGAALAPDAGGGRAWVLGTALGMAAIALGTRALFPNAIGDVRLYFLVAANLANGDLPYTDVPLEYPPLSLVPILLPYYLFKPYASAFLLTSAVWAFGIGWALLVALGRHPRVSPTRSLKSFALLACLAAPLVPWRYDLFPAFLCAWSFTCLVTGRPKRAGLLLGFGIAAKLYPVILGPAFVLYYAVRREWPGLRRLLVFTVLGAALPLSLVLLGGTDAALSFFRYHTARGLQIESTYSGIALLADAFGFLDVDVNVRWGSHNVSFAGDTSVLGAQGLLMLVMGALAYRGCYLRLRRSTASDSRMVKELGISCTLVLLAFMAASKVFSPQYIAWLLPFAPFLPLRHVRALAVVFSMTMMIFPAVYPVLVKEGLPAVVLLNARNLLVLLLIGRLLLASRRAGEESKTKASIAGS